MLVSEKVSFFSRFTQKFIEVVGAGVATAVTGYVIAHIGGFISSPAPTQPATPASLHTTPTTSAAPTATVVSKAPRAQSAPTGQPAAVEAGEQRAVPVQDAVSPNPQPARTTASVPQTAPTRKRGTAETTAAENKPRERATIETTSESKSRDAERDMEAVEAQVRAALANVDASRPAAAEPPRQAEPKPPAVAAVPPRPADAVPVAPAPAANAVAVVPPAAQQPPVQSEPLTTVEIKSRPIADVASMPDAAAQQNLPEERGLFSALKKIPDMLRPPPPPVSDPPRPPLPVGDSQ